MSRSMVLFIVNKGYTQFELKKYEFNERSKLKDNMKDEIN